MREMPLLEALDVLWVEASFIFEQALRPEIHPGPMLRGAFGRALASRFCQFREKVEDAAETASGQLRACEDCPSQRACVYNTFFRSPAPEGPHPLQGENTVPAPFVICPPTHDNPCYAQGETMTFLIAFTGQTPPVQAVIADLAGVLEQMGKQGFGEMAPRGQTREPWRRVPARLGDVRICTGLHPPGHAYLDGQLPQDNRLTNAHMAARAARLEGRPVRLHFKTPVQLNRKDCLITHITLRDVIENLAKRLNTLAIYYNLTPAGYTRAALRATALEAHAAEIPLLHAQLEKAAWRSRSIHQKRGMEGMMGHLTFPPLPRALLTCLAWGEVLHAGKATTSGMGGLFLEPVDL